MKQRRITDLHELGVVMEVIRVVEEFAKENEVEVIDTVVLQIGELSSMIPRYIYDVYPAAADGTLLENTRLDIEIIPANARCNKCGKVFNAVKNHGVCPGCQGERMELLSGREFNIKEIVCE